MVGNGGIFAGVGKQVHYMTFRVFSLWKMEFCWILVSSCGKHSTLQTGLLASS